MIQSIFLIASTAGIAGNSSSAAATAVASATTSGGSNNVSNGEVLIERHFRRGVVQYDRKHIVTDLFWKNFMEYVSKNGQDCIPPPVMQLLSTTANGETSTLYGIHIHREDLCYLAIMENNTSTSTTNNATTCKSVILVLELLNCIVATFTNYFGSKPIDITTIKDNFSIVYQLLEEIIDYGYPLTTEPNGLVNIISPPASSINQKLMNTLLLGSAGGAGALTSSTSATMDQQQQQQSHYSSSKAASATVLGTILGMPWRSANVFYKTNEIFMDIIEEVNGLVMPSSSTGTVQNLSIQGSIQCLCNLSGIPDLVLSFSNPYILKNNANGNTSKSADDCCTSFHPCVRYNVFDKDSIISFVPPNGQFELLRYKLSSTNCRASSPLYCNSSWRWHTTNSSSNNTATKSYTGWWGGSDCFDEDLLDDPITAASSDERTGILEINVGIIMFSLQHSFKHSASSAAASSGSGSTNTNSKYIVEDVSVQIPFPSHTKCTTDIKTNIGTTFYNETTKILTWNVAECMSVHTNTGTGILTCKFVLGRSTNRSINGTSASQLSSTNNHGGFYSSTQQNYNNNCSTTNTSSTTGATANYEGSGNNTNSGCTTSSSNGISNRNSTTKNGVYMSQRRQQLCIKARQQRQRNLLVEKKKQQHNTSTTKQYIRLHWSVPCSSISGLYVSGLSLTGETYHPYKGVRNICKSGVYHVQI